MTIVRSPRIRRDFTIISNAVCLDARLSMRALGLLVRMLSRPDDWHTNSEALAREFDCGRDQIRGVLRELANAGYMQLRKDRCESGQFSSKWYVFDEPQQPEPGTPAPDNRGLETRTPVDQALLPRTDLTRTYTNPQPPTGSSNGKPSEESPAEHLNTGFTNFWTTYPKKIGKDAAASAWKRKVRSLATYSEIMKAIDAQKTSDEWAKDNGKYVPNPATWLNQGRWKDECPASADDTSSGYI